MFCPCIDDMAGIPASFPPRMCVDTDLQLHPAFHPTAMTQGFSMGHKHLPPSGPSTRHACQTGIPDLSPYRHQKSCSLLRTDTVEKVGVGQYQFYSIGRVLEEC